MAVIILDKCTGCGACVAVCRFDALALETERPDGFGQKRAVVDGQKCCDCDECLIACRYQAITSETL